MVPVATEKGIMTKRVYTKIIGTGSYIPVRAIGNEYFNDLGGLGNYIVLN